jgi:hypothetical protein
MMKTRVGRWWRKREIRHRPRAISPDDVLAVALIEPQAADLVRQRLEWRNVRNAATLSPHKNSTQRRYRQGQCRHKRSHESGMLQGDNSGRSAVSSHGRFELFHNGTGWRFLRRTETGRAMEGIHPFCIDNHIPWIFCAR